MQEITRVGVDLAKQLIQVHAVNGAERVVVAKSLRPEKFAAWCAGLPAGYLRTLLVQGARSAVAAAAKKSDPISRWIVQLQARVGWQKTLVAVANKNARILWAVLARGKPYDAQHVPARPAAAGA